MAAAGGGGRRPGPPALTVGDGTGPDVRGGRGGGPVRPDSWKGRRSVSCWPRTRPGGPPSSTCWRRTGAATVRGAVDQRPHRRRARHQLAVGRALRAAGRTSGGGHRRPALDLAVRLRYAEVAARVVADPLAALDRAWTWPTAARCPTAGVGRGTAHRLPRQLHGLRRAAEPTVTRRAGSSRRWPSPWSTPTCWAPTATVGTAWCWPDGPRGGASTSSSSRPSRADRSRRPTSTASGEERTVPRCGRPRPCGRTVRSHRAVERRGGGPRGVRRLPAARPDLPRQRRPTPRRLGLLDVTTRKGTGARAVGEVVATPTAGRAAPADGHRLPTLTGFENHSGGDHGRARRTTGGPGGPGRGQRGW